MSSDATLLRDAFSASIEESPASLIARIFAALQCADLVSASRMADCLFALRGRFLAWPQVHALVTGKTQINPQGLAWSSGSERFAWHNILDDAIQTCSRYLGMPIPVLLVDVAPNLQGGSFTLESFPGLAEIRLSEQQLNTEQQQRALLFHEVAHGFLSCGVRLLDEGLAHHFAGLYGGATVPEPSMPHPLDLRILLSRAASVNLFGHGNEARAQYQQAIGHGVALIRAILARQDSSTLQHLFSALSRATDEREMFERVCAAAGITSAQSANEQAKLGADLAPLLESATATLLEAWTLEHAELLDPIITDLESRCAWRSVAGLDALLVLSLNRASLCLHAKRHQDAQAMARIDALMVLSDCLPPARHSFILALRAVVDLHLAGGNFVRSMRARQRAMSAYEHALKYAPDDAEILLSAGVFLILQQEEGGTRQVGIAHLQRAALDPSYRKHALAIMEDLGQPRGHKELMTKVTLTEHTTEPLLQVRQLSVRAGDFFQLQLDALSLHHGERLALIGPNGSGKTVLLETLLGIRPSEQGDLTWTDIHGNMLIGKTRMKKIGALIQGVTLPQQMRVRDAIQLQRSLYDIAAPEVATCLGLDELGNQTWAALSRGQAQRLLLWLALAHKPDLVILDEPSLGLDAHYVQALRQYLSQSASSLILISHVAEDVAICNRVLCLENGKLREQGELIGLVKAHVGDYYACIGDSLSATLQNQLHNLPNLSAKPEWRDEQWHLYGHGAFDRIFKGFIERHQITAFSLRPAGIGDYLNHSSRSSSC